MIRDHVRIPLQLAASADDELLAKLVMIKMKPSKVHTVACELAELGKIQMVDRLSLTAAKLAPQDESDEAKMKSWLQSAMRGLCAGGHLSTLQMYAPATAITVDGLTAACTNGHLDVVKYICEQPLMIELFLKRDASASAESTARWLGWILENLVSRRPPHLDVLEYLLTNPNIDLVSATGKGQKILTRKKTDRFIAEYCVTSYMMDAIPSAWERLALLLHSKGAFKGSDLFLWALKQNHWDMVKKLEGEWSGPVDWNKILLEYSFSFDLIYDDDPKGARAVWYCLERGAEWHRGVTGMFLSDASDYKTNLARLVKEGYDNWGSILVQACGLLDTIHLGDVDDVILFCWEQLKEASKSKKKTLQHHVAKVRRTLRRIRDNSSEPGAKERCAELLLLIK